MNPQERSLFECMRKSGETSVVKGDPEYWAHIAWPTAFVCKRSGKAKAPQSVRNALLKAKQTLELFVQKGLVSSEWEWIENKQGHRRVYWRAK